MHTHAAPAAGNRGDNMMMGRGDTMIIVFGPGGFTDLAGEISSCSALNDLV